MRKRQNEEERMTPKNQSRKKEVWRCHDDIYNAGRGNGQIWGEKEPTVHPSRTAQKAVMIQN